MRCADAEQPQADQLKWPREQFAQWVREAVDALPEEFTRLIDNVTVSVKDRLSPEEAAAQGIDERVLAFYAGQPLSKRGLGFGLPSYHGALPDQIVIIQANLESTCQSEAQLKHAIRHTVVHEFAHYFGISDERLRTLGLY